MGMRLWLCFLFLPLCLRAEDRWTYLDNGQVRLGVNLSAGACIGWFSPSKSKDNLLNAFDVGRYVQQSYYGDPDGSDWNGQPWRYDPVQGGSWKNVPAKVVERRTTRDEIYAKVHPRHWATGALLSEVTLEQWLRLDGDLARLRFKMTYSGTKQHKPYHQELPALFVPPKLTTLVLVDKTGQLSRQQPNFPNEYFILSGEPWLAWVDEKDFGLGLYMPHTQDVTVYRVRNGNRGDCSYAAPIQTFALKPGLVFEYEVALGIGSLQELRQMALREKEKSGK